jgi:hypothetical protein
MEGNRLVNVLHFFNQLKRICSHGESFGCNFSNLTLEKEVRMGLSSSFVLKCGMCNHLFDLDSQENSSIDTDINASAVRGIMSIGCGFYNLEEFLASVNVACMAQGTFQKKHDIVADVWQRAAKEVMQEAANEEILNAKETGSVDKHGVPLVEVIVDGAWSK